MDSWPKVPNSWNGGSTISVSTIAFATELHERFKRKRQTIDSARSFVMHHPHSGASGNVHVEDITELPLGVRSRMLLHMHWSQFLRFAEIHVANVQLNADVVPFHATDPQKSSLQSGRHICQHFVIPMCSHDAKIIHVSQSLTPGTTHDISQEHVDFHASVKEEHDLVNDARILGQSAQPF